MDSKDLRETSQMSFTVSNLVKDGYRSGGAWHRVVTVDRGLGLLRKGYNMQREKPGKYKRVHLVEQVIEAWGSARGDCDGNEWL